ncbi:hypothetical protein AB0A74_01680 [Saccharothrix sp. NPDC042600]|uniref:hypothetical protein n=1 Tax=Saccharothrix TaxID=2071 RepID=UPI0033C4F179|nr:hypothetical protein GCM10017745_50520 [Saccharothrix mutabilis subsp. capreolus]
MAENGPKRRQAVLVMPDVGLSEDDIESLKSNFENNLVGSLQKAGARDDVVIVVVIVVVAQ